MNLFISLSFLLVKGFRFMRSGVDRKFLVREDVSLFIFKNLEKVVSFML